MTFHLIISVDEKAPVHHVLRSGRIGIGRSPDNQVRLNHSTVSQSHLELRKSDHGGFELEDLGSRNGVSVNGNSVKRAILSDGDRLGIGKKIVAYFLLLPGENKERESAQALETSDRERTEKVLDLTGRIERLKEELVKDEKDVEILRREVGKLEAERLSQHEMCESLENAVGEIIARFRTNRKQPRRRS